MSQSNDAALYQGLEASYNPSPAERAQAAADYGNPGYDPAKAKMKAAQDAAAAKAASDEAATKRALREGIPFDEAVRKNKLESLPASTSPTYQPAPKYFDAQQVADDAKAQAFINAPVVPASKPAPVVPASKPATSVPVKRGGVLAPSTLPDPDGSGVMARVRDAADAGADRQVAIAAGVSELDSRGLKSQARALEQMGLQLQKFSTTGVTEVDPAVASAAFGHVVQAAADYDEGIRANLMVQKEQSALQAQGMAERVKLLDQHAAVRSAMLENRMTATRNALTEMRDMGNRISEQKINPTQFFDEMPLGSRILLGIRGLMSGGSKTGGQNRFAQEIDDGIRRSIDAQIYGNESKRLGFLKRMDLIGFASKFDEDALAQREALLALSYKSVEAVMQQRMAMLGAAGATAEAMTALGAVQEKYYTHAIDFAKLVHGNRQTTAGFGLPAPVVGGGAGPSPAAIGSECTPEQLIRASRDQGTIDKMSADLQSGQAIEFWRASNDAHMNVGAMMRKMAAAGKDPSAAVEGISGPWKTAIKKSWGNTGDAVVGLWNHFTGNPDEDALSGSLGALTRFKLRQEGGQAQTNPEFANSISDIERQGTAQGMLDGIEGARNLAMQKIRSVAQRDPCVFRVLMSRQNIGAPQVKDMLSGQVQSPTSIAVQPEVKAP